MENIYERALEFIQEYSAVMLVRNRKSDIYSFVSCAVSQHQNFLRQTSDLPLTFLPLTLFLTMSLRFSAVILACCVMCVSVSVAYIKAHTFSVWHRLCVLVA